MATNRARSLTPLALAVLALLAERPMHPYEMQVLMRERGHDRVLKLRAASLYDSVERLQRLGLAQPLETSREGRRPERTVYRITPAGRVQMREWLRESLSEPESEYPRFGAALAFVGALIASNDESAVIEVTEESLAAAREEVTALLQHRAARLEAEISDGQSVLDASLDRHIDRIFLIEEEYGLAMRRAELQWVQELITRIKEGGLWPSLQGLSAAEPGGGPEGQGGKAVS
ncbi:MAG: helix-turn-helix transcriptional regulator [Candidatus Dormibacteraeota bacterium]|nr:helix-turn-helix transcriptional regulator [Candidatus Dormibacteraeota bacterium]